jgi:hypothetical protein
MRRVLRAAAVAAAATSVLITPAGAAPTSTDSGVGMRLAEVRQATEEFHDVAVAEAADYESTHECVPGMGIHYVNWTLVNDPAVTPTEPEVLLYVPTSNGLRLVAVEWFKVDADGEPGTVERIDIFDRHLKGPMTHGLPLHYDLHAWVWQGNPHGVFADHNPEINCADEAAVR